MGGVILIVVKKRASLCSVSVCVLGVFCALEKVVLPPKKKFGTKTWPGAPIHGAPPRRRRIRQSANMLRDKTISLKIENKIVFNIY